MGPVGNIIINSLYECDPPFKGDIDLMLDLKKIDSKGTKVLNIKMTNKVPVDASVMVFFATYFDFRKIKN